jgi:hypothetical protein
MYRARPLVLSCRCRCTIRSSSRAPIVPIRATVAIRGVLFGRHRDILAAASQSHVIQGSVGRQGRNCVALVEFPWFFHCQAADEEQGTSGVIGEGAEETRR